MWYFWEYNQVGKFSYILEKFLISLWASWFWGLHLVVLDPEVLWSFIHIFIQSITHLSGSGSHLLGGDVLGRCLTLNSADRAPTAWSLGSRWASWLREQPALSGRLLVYQQVDPWPPGPQFLWCAMTGLASTANRMLSCDRIYPCQPVWEPLVTWGYWTLGVWRAWLMNWILHFYSKSFKFKPVPPCPVTRSCCVGHDYPRWIKCLFNVT